MRRSALLLAGLIVLAACGEGDGNETPAAPTTEPREQASVDLAVEPSCVEAGDAFTVTATGLEPGEEYGFLVDPRPEPLEGDARAEADADGVAELPGSISEDLDVEAGDHTWSVVRAGEDDELASDTFRIAETCAPMGGGAWEELPAAPIGNRLNHTTTWAGGLVIVWGGEEQDTFEIAADGAAWDPVSGEWHEVPAAPIEGRWAHEAVWTGDELIVWGGSSGPDHLATCFTDGARYDPAEGTWEVIPEAPGPRRCTSQVAWADGELLVFGGHSGEGPPGPGDRHDDGAAYDPATGDWRELPPAPIAPRAGGVAGWVGGELVVYGGHTHAEDGEGFQYLADGAAYDPDTDEWRVIAESPLPPLRGVEGVAIGDELMLLGGSDPDLGVDERSMAVAAYDPQADEWRTLADLPGAHGTMDVVPTGDVVYLLGGGLPEPPPGESAAEDEAAPPFLAYVVEGDSWVEWPDPPGGPHRHHASAWTGAELVVWGGQAGEDPAPGVRWAAPA